MEALAAKKAAHPSAAEDDAESRKKRKIRAEMREAWSEQKDKKVRKEERREKRERHKQAEWEAKLASGDTELSMVDKFKAERAAAAKAAKPVDLAARAEEDKDYRSLRKEVQEEKAARKRDKAMGSAAGIAAGMFDGLD